MKRIYTYIPSPLGKLTLVSDGEYLTGLYMQGQQYEQHPTAEWRRDDQLGLFEQTDSELREYFCGYLQRFTIPLRMDGTSSQRQLWQLLSQIPYATTVTYGALAAQLGDPSAARAIGHMVGLNPISVIIPCHRVVGSTGALTGYNGGLERKRQLLDLETGRMQLGV